jgi:hypothetical protein
MRRRIVIIATVVLVTSIPSAAQTRQGPRRQSTNAPDRVFVSINAAYQATSNDFDETVVFHQNAEDSRVKSGYRVESGPAIDLAGRLKIWRDLGVAVGLTRYVRSTPTAIDASLPHPFFFGRPRTIDAAVGGLDRRELAVHLQVRGVVAVTPRVQISVFSGPSLFRVDQDIVNDVEIVETYPYDEATFGRAITARSKASKAGVNIGADLAYFFTRHVGVGFGAQYAGTTIELTSARGRFDVKAGGLQAGGGLRLRFDATNR